MITTIKNKQFMGSGLRSGGTGLGALLCAGLMAISLGQGTAQAATGPFCTAQAGGPQTGNPVLFVTQVPIHADFATIGSVFANHSADMGSVGRGGDLYIRYPDGTLCNLTREGGYGMDGFQGDDAIAVRDPAMHWSGTKAIFSMVVGGPGQQFEYEDYYWQLYEVTGLGMGDAVTITKVPNQPLDFNNVQPIYDSEDRIVYVSDRPRNGARHLYPQHDEYESTPTPTGLWRLDPGNGELILLQHSPSGSFDPIIDSYGRVVFIRWDHLQRDQQAGSTCNSGTFNYSDESANATVVMNGNDPDCTEVFPEPRPAQTDLLAGTNLNGHRINHFFPWMINQDGSGEETLNHIGRHELHGYFDRAMNDDPNLIEFIDTVSGRVNPNSILNFLHVREDPTQPGRFLGTAAPEFDSHASGQLIAIAGAPADNPDQMVVEYITHPDTRGTADSPDHSGHYRDAAELMNGMVISSHTHETGGVGAYDFRIKTLQTASNGFQESGASLTPGIVRNISYWDPDNLVTHSGPMWELNAVEVRARTIPGAVNEPALSAPEQAVFDDEGVSVSEFRQFLRENGLALMVARDITSRDDADRQQPFNIQVPGGVASIPVGGTVYEVSFLQYVQGDQIRGIGGASDPRDGRRVIAQWLHHPRSVAINPPVSNAPPGSVAVAPDGSTAAFVPTRRAMAWQTTEPDGTPVVRERYWITFQPGEIRVCDGCHGVNQVNHMGGGQAQNEPEALRLLLQHWRDFVVNDDLFSDSLEDSP